MPIFEYRGLNKDGRNVKGAVDAESARAAKIKLRKDGIFVTDVKDKGRLAKKNVPGKRSVSQKSVSITELSMMTRQLATLIKANIPLVDALTAVAEQVENPFLSEAVADIKNSVNEGGALNKALGKYPKVFDKIYVSMCEAGEMSGTLDVILIRLAEFKESQSALTAKIKSAML
jgi:general secretion pathway protein F